MGRAETERGGHRVVGAASQVSTQHVEKRAVGEHAIGFKTVAFQERHTALLGAPFYLAHEAGLANAGLAGQSLALGQPGLIAYLVVFLVAVVTFVYLYEEPTLSARYGAEYDEYRRAVPGWLPRLTPWRPTAKG